MCIVCDLTRLKYILLWIYFSPWRWQTVAEMCRRACIYKYLAICYILYVYLLVYIIDSTIFNKSNIAKFYQNFGDLEFGEYHGSEYRNKRACSIWRLFVW
jgi:hypothetical protein